jgi:hypothetical protein
MPRAEGHAERLERERARVEAEYRRRRDDPREELYAPWQPAEAFLREGRRRAATQLLREADVFPRSGDPCLEIGCGSIGWLGELVSWGLREADLHGIELDPVRFERVRQALPSADLRQGDATELPWPDGAFRLVILSTVVTSILDAEVRRQLCAESVRVLQPGAALLWYDFAVDNPRNPAVRRVARTELAELFPTLRGRVRSVTLAPPLARAVAPRSWACAAMLESLPFLRTHLVAVLKKPQ